MKGRTDPAARFIERIDVGPGDCLTWVGARTPTGYGNFFAEGYCMRAHRFAYKRFKGEIPPGTEIDHLCRNRACVNPSHLEAVPHRTNTLRGDTVTAANARKTHCSRGHEFTPPNTSPKPGGGRRCLTCVPLAIGPPNGLKTHCKRGHEFTPTNTLKIKFGRSCRSCHNARRRVAEVRLRATRAV